VKVAVVGCGAWGRNIVRTISSEGYLHAVVDPDPQTAADVAATYGVVAASFADVLADSDIDAVMIAAPAAQHARLAEQALLAEKHVFVEKPLALEVRDGERLAALAIAQDRTLMVGHLLQYHPAFLRLRELVEEGAIGRLQYLSSNRLNLGRFRREENILWSFAPHDISMILSLVGAEPENVVAIGARYLHDRIADVTTTHLAFPGGERAHIHVSWLHPFKEQTLIVVGDRGMLVFDDGKDWDEKVTIYAHRISWSDRVPIPVKADAQPVVVLPSEPLLEECRHFLTCASTGARPRTDGAEALRVLRVLQAAERSLVAGGIGAKATGGLAIPASEPLRPGVHATVEIDDDVEIGAGTRVWHFSHLLSGTRIGSDCTLGQNVVVGPDVSVGDRCKIQNNVSLYRGVTLESGVFCGPSAVFTNVLNPRAEVERKDEFRATLVRRGASIGANATIVCGVTIGEYALVGAGAVVTDDVGPYELVVGVPARPIGWVSGAGERLDESLVCPRTGERYELVDGRLRPLEGSES
jgi:predicted dehydrogenase/acetyltransferase-like isoleucine patch superfamily enzyme